MPTLASALAISLSFQFHRLLVVELHLQGLQDLEDLGDLEVRFRFRFPPSYQQLQSPTAYAPLLRRLVRLVSLPQLRLRHQLPVPLVPRPLL